MSGYIGWVGVWFKGISIGLYVIWLILLIDGLTDRSFSRQAGKHIDRQMDGWADRLVDSALNNCGKPRSVDRYYMTQL